MTPQQLKKQYVDCESFLDAFSAEKQTEITKNLHNVWFGEFPTLGVINNVFPNTAQKWLILQIDDLQKYVRLGDSEKFTTLQFIQLVELIFREFYYLKVSEIMYFFMLIKSATFGKIYNKIDPLNIMEWLRQFIVFYRKPAIDEGMQQIETAYYKWHDQYAVKGRDFNRELPAIMKLINSKEDSKSENIATNSTDKILESALGLVNNTAGLMESDLESVSKIWAKKYGCTPQEYIKNNKG